MHVPAHAKLELLSDIQLGRALVHHQYMLELPAGYFQHPDTADASQAVTVVAKATLKIKGFVLTHLATLHTAWQNTRRATVKHRVQLEVTRQTINRIEQQAQTLSAFFKQVLPVHPPMPHTLPFRGAARNKVWLAIVSDFKVDANLLANIDMLQPDPARRCATMASHFRPFWLTAEQEEWER